MDEILVNFKAHLRDQDKAVRTVSAYTADVAAFVAWSEARYSEAFTLAMCNRPDAADYRKASRFEQRVSAATWNRRWASLREFSQWLVMTGRMEYDFTDSLKRAKSARRTAPRGLSMNEFLKFRRYVYEDILRMAKTPAARLQALRDRAVIALMMEAGLREGEVVALQLQDLQLGERKGRVYIRAGKDDIDGSAPLNYEAVCALKAWMSERPPFATTESFHARSGRVLKDSVFFGKFHEPLQEGGIQKMVKKYGRLAGVKVMPHMLRHTAAARAMRASRGDMAKTGALLRHVSMQSTKVYTLPQEQDLEKLVEVM